MAVPVGGANGLIDRLLVLLSWRATAVTTDNERVNALQFLQFADRFVCQRHALLFLNYTWSISMTNGLTAIDLTAAPFTTVGFDFSKDHVLFDGDGFPVKYCSLDEFAEMNADTDMVGTGPGGYIISVDSADSKRKLLLNAAHSGSATWKLHGQRYPAAITDDAGSFMNLPEGDELVLGLPIAEQFGKQRKRELDAQMLDQQTRDSLDAFYGKHRANKLTPATDANHERRVNEKRAKQIVGV
jgi:hypothetical protein